MANILDLAGINAWILCKKITVKKISREDFMFQLADELATENVKPGMESLEANVQRTSKSSLYSRK